MKKLDDKTKNMAVGALGVVLLGVGAFRFLGKHSGPAKPASAQTAAKSQTATNGTADPSVQPVIVNPAYATPLPNRDPFAEPVDETTPPAGPVVVQPKTKVNPLPLPGSRPPHGLDGSLPPLLPNPGDKGGLGIAAVKTPPPVFMYQLHGVIEGAHPAALFADPNGDQRLISLGKSLDGDTKLLNVGDHGAVVLFHGKKLHLTLGINPSNK